MSSEFPMRCFTCNKVIANLEKKWNEMKEERKTLTMKDFNELGITRYCCVRMFMGYVPLNVYPKVKD
jgi:DNA-directed RNA polymerase subunit N (RpoN/RPB10)